MYGISNFKELLAAINDFGRLYHKHERNQVAVTSVQLMINDYGGNTEHMMATLCVSTHDRNFALKGENDDAVPKPEETH